MRRPSASARNAPVIDKAHASGGDGVPRPGVSLDVRRCARLLGAIELLGVLREGLSAGARLDSISRASSRTRTAPSLRRSAGTVSCIS